MAELLKAATMYYLSYYDGSSMLFITGQGRQCSTVRTNTGLRYMCNSAFGLDLSCDALVDAYSAHPLTRSPVTLVVELEEWANRPSSKLQGDMEQAIAGLCEIIPPVNNSAQWTKAIVKELMDMGLFKISLNTLKAREEAAKTTYGGPGTEMFRTARAL